MTRQVTEGTVITVVARSQVGGVIPDAPVTVNGGAVYKDPALSDAHDEPRTAGDGSFTFYASPGVYEITVDDPIAVGVEPVQVVGVGDRPGGASAVHPDEAPAVHESSPVSEHVSDASLVGAPVGALPEDEGGAAAMVRVGDNAVIEPGEPSDVPTPDGTTATDPSAAAVPSTESNIVTPDGQTVAAADYQAPDQPAEPQQ